MDKKESQKEKHNEWLTKKLAYIRGLKYPNEQQKLLLMLCEKPEKTNADNRAIAALIKAERSAERAKKAKIDADRIFEREKEKERKARDHELYKSAGLMILAGLVDSKTGKPTRDAAELLGALLDIAANQTDEGRRAIWREKGAAFLHSPPQSS